MKLGGLPRARGACVLSETTTAAFPPWSKERDAELAVLWGRDVTTGEIGRQLGVSKNAVCGRAHRLHLPGRPSPIKYGHRFPRTHPRAGHAGGAGHAGAHGDLQIDRAPKISRAPLVPRARVALERAASWPRSAVKTCCYPLWPDDVRPTHVYCGAPAVLRPKNLYVDGRAVPSLEAASYCAEHFALCTLAPRKRGDRPSGDKPSGNKP